MTAAVTANNQDAAAMPKAFAVWFEQLDRWSLGSFRTARWQWPAHIIQPLGEALDRRLEPVDREKTDPEDIQLITLHFDGSIARRQTKGTKPIKGRLWWANPGDVVYSKIDVRNGAIGIVPDELGRVCVTSEYPVYAVDQDRTLAEYIKLVFRTKVFRGTINGMISGASGRKRVQPEALEDIEIPLPDREVQRAIVAAWTRAQAEVADLRRRAEQREAQIETDFLAALGLPKPKRGKLPKSFGMHWEDVKRWSVIFNQHHLSEIKLEDGKYPCKPLDTALTGMQYGSSTKANTSGDGVAILRMNNIVDGSLRYADIKHVVLGSSERESLELNRGDILINRTNSKELVGKCAVFDSSESYVFASYLIRLRLNPSLANPEYISYFINCCAGRQQIDKMSRPIGGQANINSEEIRSISILLPPLHDQLDIAKAITNGRKQVAALKLEADHLAAQAKADVEAMILGRQPVEI